MKCNIIDQYKNVIILDIVKPTAGDFVVYPDKKFGLVKTVELHDGERVDVFVDIGVHAS